MQLYVISLGIIMPIWLYLISLIKYHNVGLSFVLILMLFSVMLISWASMQKIKNKRKSFYALYVVGIVLQIACYINIIKYNIYTIEIILHILIFIIITVFMTYICKVELPKYDEDRDKLVGKLFTKHLITTGFITYIPAFVVIKLNNIQIKELLINSNLSHNTIPSEVWHKLNITKLTLVVIMCYSLLFMYITYNKTVARVKGVKKS